MKYAYRLGKSLMLPVACLPVAGLLMGIGFWMDPVGHGDSYLISQILVKAGSILIDHMSLLFTLGVNRMEPLRLLVWAAGWSFSRC